MKPFFVKDRQMILRWDKITLYIADGRFLHMLVQEQLELPLKFGVRVVVEQVLAAVLTEFLEELVRMHLKLLLE